MKQTKIVAHITIKNRKESINALIRTLNEYKEKINYLESELNSKNKSDQENAIAYSLVFINLWTKAVDELDKSQGDVMLDFMDGKHNVN